MYAVAGFDRALPLAGRKGSQPGREWVAELLGNLVVRHRRELALKQERVTEQRGVRPAAELFQLCEQVLRIARQVVAVLYGLEVDVTEREPLGQAKRVGVRLQIREQ